MEANESQRVVAFQLQFDKPTVSQTTIAEWNPEKDLLAMVTEDSKLLLHHFNWQRLWTTSPGKCITSICWRPDGKAIAVGLEDGTISLHDVENGKLLRSMKFHCVSVICLNWVEDRKKLMDGDRCNSTYEDRTARFFPPAPRVPQTPGLVQGDSSSFMDENDDSFRELFDSSHQQFDILCSGDKDGNIYFNIFGIFPIGKVNIHDIAFRSPLVENHASYQLMDASICKMALSSDICHIMVLCSGVLTEIGSEASDTSESHLQGFHSLVLDCSIFQERKNELHQVARQASNAEHLFEVIRKSIDVMSKQWSDAMHMETMQRVTELAYFGGFLDSEYLKRTLATEFQQLESCLKKALEMPLATVSRRILCKDVLPLFPVSPTLVKPFPTSVSYYQEAFNGTTCERLTDYTSFMVPDDFFPNMINCIGITRGLIHDLDYVKSGHNTLEVTLLSIPDGYHCVDLSLYKEEHIVLLLNDVSMASEGSENACMMITQTAGLTFVPISRSSVFLSWNLHKLQDFVTFLQLENEKVREISHSVVAPLAVSASRGVACVFAAKKRALVYILEEDEDEDEATDSE
ncbi:hypothetical protein ACS0TY_033905 [Phlomoides rotata]